MHIVLITVLFNDSKGESKTLTFQWDSSTQASLFQAVDQHGQELPHGCLAGSCGACRVEILEGQELLLPPSPVEQDTLSHILRDHQELRGKEIRLSCRTKFKPNASGKLALRSL